MRCEEIRPSIDALVDGELSREEERVLRAHVAGCPACARELEDRRSFSESLRGAFDRALEAAEPPSGAREKLAGRLHARSRRRLAVPARLAAAMVFGIAVGLAAWAVGLSRPTRLQVDVARKSGDIEAKSAEISALKREIKGDLEQVLRTGLAADPQDSRALVVQESAVAIEARMTEPAAKGLPQLVADTASPDAEVRGGARSALRRLPPSRVEDLRRALKEVPACDAGYVERIVAELEDRAQPVERGKVQMSKSVNGVTLTFAQMGDGRVRLVVPGRTIETASMAELLRRHGDVCRQFSISGRDGFVTIDGSTAAVDLRGQLDLLFRTGNWTDDVQWDAYRAWMSGRTPDARQVEAKVREMQERCRRAVQEAPVPSVRVDVEQILKDVKAMTRQELEKEQERVEKDIPALEARLQELRELRARARGLRVFAEDVKKDK